MSLATYQDANAWLDESKLRFDDAQDAAPEADNADKMVKAYMGDIFPEYLDLWAADDQTNPTPAIIREAAALLMAAYRERKIYAINELGTPNHAVWLEEKAMSILTGIRDGAIIVTDAVVAVDIGNFSVLDFYPNDATEIEDEKSGRKFTMGMEF